MYVLPFQVNLPPVPEPDAYTVDSPFSFPRGLNHETSSRRMKTSPAPNQLRPSRFFSAGRQMRHPEGEGRAGTEGTMDSPPPFSIGAASETEGKAAPPGMAGLQGLPGLHVKGSKVPALISSQCSFKSRLDKNSRSALRSLPLRGRRERERLFKS